MQNTPSQCDPELQKHEDNIESLFFLLNPQLHSHIVQLERLERNKLEAHVKLADKTSEDSTSGLVRTSQRANYCA
jgi:hypothetical protein